MPYSDELKVFWFTPMRTASRSVSQVLEYLNFKNPRTHDFIRIPEHHNYYFIVNIKNPYNRLVSIYHIQKYHGTIEVDFDVWVPRRLSEEFNTSLSNFHTMERHINIFHYFKDKKPDYIVRSEFLENDIRNIWFIKENNSPLLEQTIQNHICKNVYEKEWDFVKPWRSYYNQNLADIVYGYMKDNFDFFGYDKNSWKDGTS
jgi:hypothetical protein